MKNKIAGAVNTGENEPFKYAAQKANSDPDSNFQDGSGQERKKTWRAELIDKCRLTGRQKNFVPSEYKKCSLCGEVNEDLILFKIGRVCAECDLEYVPRRYNSNKEQPR